MRLIDADALILIFCDNPSYSATMFSKIRGRIKAAPTIEAEPVKHGRWIEKVGRAECSACYDECWADSALEYNYCPNCGAKMDEEATHASD